MECEHKSGTSSRSSPAGRQALRLPAAVLLLLLGAASPAAEAAKVAISLGGRYGEGAPYGDHRQFNGQELFLRVEPQGWRELWPNIGAAFEFAGGRFRNGGKKANAFLAGPVLTWRQPGHDWALEAGIRLTWLSEHEIGNRDLGGLFQFTSHLGFVWHFNAQLAAAVRLQHTSNSSLYSKNPGLDLQMLELRYHF